MSISCNKTGLLACLFLLAMLGACTGQQGKPAEESKTPEAVQGFPTEQIKHRNICFDIDMKYPFVGRPEIDQQIRIWVDRQYYDTSEELLKVCESMPEDAHRPYEYLLNYKVSTTPGAVSILFDSYSFTGGAHGMDGMTVLNLSLRDGEELRYADLFADTTGLYTFLSDYVYKALYPKLGNIWMGSPLFTEGLEPVEESFKIFVITPQGLTVHFPTYQIAPHSEGPQSCDIPLEALVRFKPRPGIWQ